NLGFVYERLHLKSKASDPNGTSLAEAIRHYQAAADLDPKNPVFFRNLGLAARQQAGQGELALRALKEAVALEPKDYSSHVALAEEFQNGKQTKPAIQEYKAALALRPAQFVPHFNLGLLYYLQEPPNLAEPI